MNRKAFQSGRTFVALVHDDALRALRNVPPDTFNVAITSPPYFWARDYGDEKQIGHEQTVDGYVRALADVFDEIKRVLHPEGVFYLNIGDTYYSGNGQPHGADPRSPSRNFMRKTLRAVDRSGWGIPKKSLLGVPWKVAFEMQSRGWTLRSDIVWNRINAFVEPTARDRPYRQYEHVFLFSKSRFYSYDRSALGGEEDVWSIPIDHAKQGKHSAAFPAELVRRCVLSGSPSGGWVIDPFVGSGTTLEVALSLGRHSFGIDLSRQYYRQMVDLLRSAGCQEIEWDTLERSMHGTPPGWMEWRGNKLNLRRPRSGLSQSKLQKKE